MTWWHSHPDAADLVRRNWPKAELLIVAQREPCIRIRRQELENLNRVIEAVDPDDLRRWTPKGSWLAAVLVCEGDETGQLAAVVVELGLDPRRFHFYLHKQAKRESLRGWTQAELPLDAVDEGIEDWRDLHKLLGVDFNVRIVDDAMGHT